MSGVFACVVIGMFVSVTGDVHRCTGRRWMWAAGLFSRPETVLPTAVLFVPCVHPVAVITMSPPSTSSV